MLSQKKWSFSKETSKESIRKFQRKTYTQGNKKYQFEEYLKTVKNLACASPLKVRLGHKTRRKTYVRAECESSNKMNNTDSINKVPRS